MQLPLDATGIVSHFDARITAFEGVVARMIAESEARIIASIDGAPSNPPADPEPPAVDPPSSTGSDSKSGGNLADGWLVRDPKPDAIRLEAGQSIHDAVTTGRDVLLPAGSVWTITEPLEPRDGQLIGVYGDGDRPEINAKSCTGFALRSVSNVQLVGLAIRLERSGQDDERGIDIRGTGLSGILIEDCLIEGGKDNIAAVSGTQVGDTISSGLTISRCILLGAWSARTHATNFYVNRWDNWQVIETVMDGVQIAPDGTDRRDDQSHNIYAQYNAGDPHTTGLIDGCYLARGSSHGFQVRSRAHVRDTISDGNAIVGSIFSGGSVERFVGMNAVNLPGNNPLGVGLQALGGVEVEDVVLARRLAETGRKVALQIDGGDTPVNVRVLGPWTTNSYGPVRAGDGRYSGPGVFYSEDPDDFRDASAKVSEGTRDAWLGRPRGVVPKIKAECARLLEAYQID
ncbi:MAG: hypothetical protein AAGI37_19695 [Planctomycetota bacterium]